MVRRWRAARPLGRAIAVTVVVVVLAAVGTGIWWFTGRDRAAAAPTDGATTTTAAASLTTLQKSVTASGTLTPTVQESVSFAVSGTVTAVDVAAGDTVTEGQTLATVDTLELGADLLSAKADLASAEATLADLEDADDGSDTAQAQIDAASARVDVAQAAVDAANEAMSDATLVAPVAGLVTSADLEVGDVVSGSSSGSSGSSSSAGSAPGGSQSTSSSSSSGQFTIVGTDAYEVELSVDDADVALIAAGDQVELTSDDLDGTVFGVVRSIGLLSTSTGVASYPVVVDVTGDTSTLHDGISVDAEIVYERRTDVLTVPSAAITTNADGTTTVTKVASDGTASTVTVTTGETSGTVTEITAGLSEGDEVQVTTYARADSTSGTQGELPGGGQFEFPGGEMPGGGQMPGGQNGQAPAQMGFRGDRG
jgi:macrolide-specific efflux system membrane fusion protein